MGYYLSGYWDYELDEQWKNSPKHPALRRKKRKQDKDKTVDPQTAARIRKRLDPDGGHAND